MQTVNNTEPMPHTPQGANGHWEWDGNTTAKYRSTEGQEWLLKGAWRWVRAEAKKQTPLANATVSQIVEWHRPKVAMKPTEGHAIDGILHKVIIASAIIITLSILSITLL